MSKKEVSEKSEGMKLGFKIAGFFIILLAVFAGVLVFMNHYWKTKAEKVFQEAIQQNPGETETIQVNDEIVITDTTLRTAISAAQDLVAYKYYYSGAGKYEKSKKIFNKVKVPFTTDEAIYTYEGVIGAGIDVSAITFDIDHQAKKIIVSSPQPVIQYHEVNEQSFEFYDVKKAIFNRSNLKDYPELVRAIKAQQEGKLQNNQEFWNQTRNNTEVILTGLLQASGTIDDYTIIYKWE